MTNDELVDLVMALANDNRVTLSELLAEIRKEEVQKDTAK